MRHLIKFSRNINSIFLKTNVILIVQRIYESDDKCRVLRHSLTQEKERVTGQNFFSSITDETHRCGIETGRSVMSVVWVEKPPSHQQGPGCYDAITCKGNGLYLSRIGFCFMNIGKINQLKKIYGPYVLFVWHWLYMYIELIRRNYVDDIGDNVTDKL